MRNFAMKITIQEKKENPFLNRVEVKGNVSFEGATPSNDKMIESLAKEFKTEAVLVVMKKIDTKFSFQEAGFLAFVYKNQESRNKTERPTSYLKKKAEEAKKAAGAAATEEKAKEVKE